MNEKNIKIWEGKVEGYKLLDSGNKEKLEEIIGENGKRIKIVRAEPRAWWKPELPKKEWENIQTEFETIIDIGIGDLKAKVKYKKSSKHIGIFPEQIGQWQWIVEKLERCKLESKDKETNVLNLFGYTGIASLVAAKAGAMVTHVDASKHSVDWARENQKISRLEDASIRWIVDDVLKFLKKEIKRGVKYDAVIMDPPSYGKGPNGEVWKIEEQIGTLLPSVKEILSDNPLFIIFNMYSTELSAISVANLLKDLTKDLGGTVQSGELVIKHQNSEKLLPMSIFAIWSHFGEPSRDKSN